MIKKITLFLYLIPIILFAQQTNVISGNTEIKRDNYAYLYVINDAYTNVKELVETSLIDEKGNFSFNIKNEETRKFEIYIDNIKGSIYLAPGKNYTIQFPDLKENQVKSVSGVSNVALRFNNLDSLDVNNVVRVANLLYDDFFSRNVDIITNGPGFTSYELGTVQRPTSNNPLALALYRYDSLQKKIFKPVIDKFSLDYIKFSNANLERKILRTSAKKLFKKYISTSTIEIDNIENTIFFSTFYLTLVKGIAFTGKQKELFNKIATKAPFIEIDSMLTKNDFLKDSTLRKAVFLMILFNNQKSKNLNKDHLSYYLPLFLEDSNSNISRLAKGIKKKTSKLKKGVAAYNFKLVDPNGDTISLKQLQGKHTYITFWDDWCTECLGEMKFFEDFQKKYKKSVNLVTIYLGNDKNAFNRLKRLAPRMRWYFLIANEQKEVIKNEYEVKTLPLYYLLDSYGHFKEIPALRPTPNGIGKSIDETLYYIHNRGARKKKYVGTSEYIKD